MLGQITFFLNKYFYRFNSSLLDFKDWKKSFGEKNWKFSTLEPDFEDRTVFLSTHAFLPIMTHSLRDQTTVHTNKSCANQLGFDIVFWIYDLPRHLWVIAIWLIKTPKKMIVKYFKLNFNKVRGPARSQFFLFLIQNLVFYQMKIVSRGTQRDLPFIFMKTPKNTLF